MKTSIWKSYPVGQDVGLKFGQTATGSTANPGSSQVNRFRHRAHQQAPFEDSLGNYPRV